MAREYEGGGGLAVSRDLTAVCRPLLWGKRAKEGGSGLVVTGSSEILSSLDVGEHVAITHNVVQ